LTQFRAEWTDETPAENVDSYTLEVRTKPLVDLLEAVDFGDVPDALTEDGQGLADISDHYSDYLPEGWSCTPYMFAYGGTLIAGYDGTIKSPIYNLTGYDKMTVVVNACSYYQSYYGDATATVMTSMDSQSFSLGADFETQIFVLDCASNDRMTIQAGENFTCLQGIEIYAGDLTQANLRASESGDDVYRLITGITDKRYVVRDLMAGGNFIYKVKSQFIDGTESAWSNVQEVYLIENMPPHQNGDVNHDGSISIGDVTALIDYLLGNVGDSCPICADVNGDEAVSIADVTALIDILLSSK
jgi:hypothetical protein